MMQPIVIVGANEDYQGQYPTEQELSQLAGYIKKTIPVRVINIEPNFELNTVKYTDGSTKSYKSYTIKLSPETLPINYPTNTSSFEELFYVHVLSRKYLFVKLNDYKILPEGLPNDCFIKVSLISYSVSHSPGYKTISLELSVR